MTGKSFVQSGDSAGKRKISIAGEIEKMIDNI